MTTPRAVKLFDIHDIALSLASLNANGDVTGELVDVGAGRAQDFEGKDVTGKFVLAVERRRAARTRQADAARRDRRARPSARSASQRDVRLPESDRLDDGERDAARTPSPGRCRPNAQREPRGACCARGQKITIRSIVEERAGADASPRSSTPRFPATAARRRKSAIGGHLYEGVIKQGANDDNSGCALTLEIGRTYLKLINEGKLPRPKRTINFQWVPEISGTNAWLNAHPDKAKAIIGDLNFDMEAIRVAESRSYWILQRTPDTFPSYINDIAQSMMEYVADISRERVRFRAQRLRADAAGRVAARQQGRVLHQDRQALRLERSRDLHAARHSGRHVHHLAGHVVPLVARTRPTSRTPTQYKRAAVVGTGALAVLATGTDEMAARVLNDNLGRGLVAHGRVAHQGPRLHGRRDGRGRR